ncbi:MAG: hypothetical protein QW835_06725 [Candidatus Hadarchaeum sp.]|uniref:hypothetical protein n=1 Tax=Candidatus Hadarchaeum sp. TaxID=2883567 RepID=UPI00316B3C9E
MVERLTVDSLRKRVIVLKEEKIKKSRPELGALVQETNKECAALSESLKELHRSDPDEAVHYGLVKTAIEARKLFYEKISRAITIMECAQELTGASIPKINERFSKATSIIGDAMKAHGRYVRAVFVKKYSEFEFHLRKLYELVTQTQSILNRIIGEMKALDDLISEISAYQQIQLEMEKIKENIASLQDNSRKIDAEINEAVSQLARLKGSPEFKKITESAEELERTRHEINREKETATSLISELNRPFRKLEKILDAGEYQMGPETRRILEICIYEPTELISSDEKLTLFEKLLHETTNLANSGKIDLDKRERKNLEIATRFLPSRLKNIKNNLATLVENAETKKKESESPVFDQAGKLENLIKKLEEERKEAQNTVDELKNRVKLKEEELVSRKNNLQKLASEVLGTRVEITF